MSADVVTAVGLEVLPELISFDISKPNIWTWNLNVSFPIAPKYANPDAIFTVILKSITKITL